MVKKLLTGGRPEGGGNRSMSTPPNTPMGIVVRRGWQGGVCTTWILGIFN